MRKSIDEVLEEEIEELEDDNLWCKRQINEIKEIIDRSKGIMDTCDTGIQDELWIYIKYGNIISEQINYIKKYFYDIRDMEEEISSLKLILEKKHMTMQ